MRNASKALMKVGLLSIVEIITNSVVKVLVEKRFEVFKCTGLDLGEVSKNGLQIGRINPGQLSRFLYISNSRMSIPGHFVFNLGQFYFNSVQFCSESWTI